MTSPSPANAPTSMRWQLNRAGIVNVYQYENETIDFGGGRLLLRGVNGSGKSTAMNMLLPFLLTARTRGIDAAGEQTGVLKSWMLSGRDEAQPIGYLWVEFARRRAEHDAEHDTDDDTGNADHLVIGCGIKANRSTDNVSTWWFVTTKRPGIDFEVIERTTPLGADALRVALEPDPVFANDRRADYRSEVARRLYGGADIDAFLDLLNTVRSPRVGDRVDVDLPEHLVAALPGLSEQALTEAARPLDDLDEHRRNVTDLGDTATGLAAIGEVYRNYVLTEIDRETADATATVATADAARKRERADQLAADQAATAETEAGEIIDGLEADTVRLTEEIAALEKSPAYTDGQQLDDLRTLVATLNANVSEQEQRVADLTARLPAVADDVRRHEARVDSDLGQLAEQLATLDGSTAAASLTSRPPTAPGMARTNQDGDVNAPDEPFPADALGAQLDAVAGSAQLRTADTAEVRTLISTVEHEELELRSTESAHDVAESNVADAVEHFGQTRRALDDEYESWDDAVTGWSREAMPVIARHEADVPALVAAAARTAGVPGADRHAFRAELVRDVDTLLGAEQRLVADAEHAVASAEAVVVEAEQVLDELNARTEPDPPSLDWQQRSGPSFADLVDFRDELGHDERAGLEAALEASGLLAASVIGGGLQLASGELVAMPSGGVESPLSESLTVTIDDDTVGSVDPGLVAKLLDSVSTDMASDASSVVATNGSFRLGSLSGRHEKVTAEFVGVGARRARLERQRADAGAALAASRLAHGRTVTELDVRHSRRADVAGLRDRLPSLAGIDTALARSDAAEQELDRARVKRDELAALMADADRRLAAANDELGRVSRTLSLPADRAGLDALDRTLSGVVAGCRSARDKVATVLRSCGEWTAAVDRWREARTDLAAATRQATETRSDRDGRAARLATLEDSLGIAYHEVTAAIELSRADLTEVQRRLPGSRTTHQNAIRTHQDARNTAAASSERRRAAELACVAAYDHLVDVLAVAGLLDAIGPRIQPSVGEPGAATPDTPPTTVAATIPAATADADGLRVLLDHLRAHVARPVDGGTTADGVRISLRNRRSALGAGWDAEDRQPDPRLPLSVSVNGPLGTMPLPDAIDKVGDQLAQLSALLTQKQDQALRTLLQGMVAREVAEKMHKAATLVDLMNERLGSVTTAHGIGVRLRWRRSAELDDATARTVAVLAKLPDLRTEAEEADLRDALAARLADARRLEPDASYRHLIGQVFDYRRWFDMDVLLRRSGESEKRLSRKTPLSEGEKKLVTYLPLFAAVAASCDAVAEAGGDVGAHAPRFLLLDDAFAKVSEDNHAKLFGLLVELDLDFIATSERLWGTHSTVPELAITEVVRDAELGVILLEHSRWNGHTLHARHALHVTERP